MNDSKQCQLLQQEDSALASTVRLTELPREVVGLTFRFLTGFDLLQLSHVDHKLYYGLLASDSEVWRRLAPSGSPLYPILLGAPRRLRSVPAKQRYCSHRSLYFHEGHTDETYIIGGAILAPSVDAITSGGSFSFDVCFALLPERDSDLTHAGGAILLRAQHHQHLVRTDSEGNLYCSVVNHQPIVAERLAFYRWFHLALVFDMKASGAATQRVFLDGELVDTTEGRLNAGWSSHAGAQLGTWYTSDDALGFETGERHAFHGLVNECRFWGGVLRTDAVRDLANGVSADQLDTTATCAWSARDVTIGSASGVISFARSTTPAERTVSQLEITEALSRSTTARHDARFRCTAGCQLLAHVLG